MRTSCFKRELQIDGEVPVNFTFQHVEASKFLIGISKLIYQDNSSISAQHGYS